MKTGYGQFALNKKVHTAHRAAYILTYGPIPDGIFALHRCDNRACVNPSHLFLGTASDNTQDMLAKGRCNPPRGESSGATGLTNEEILHIRQLYQKGDLSMRTIGKNFGLQCNGVFCIVHGVTWKEIGGPIVPLLTRNERLKIAKRAARIRWGTR